MFFIWLHCFFSFNSIFFPSTLLCVQFVSFMFSLYLFVYVWSLFQCPVMKDWSFVYYSRLTKQCLLKKEEEKVSKKKRPVTSLQTELLSTKPLFRNWSSVVVCSRLSMEENASRQEDYHWVILFQEMVVWYCVFSSFNGRQRITTRR